MRTNIEIDDELMAKAMKATGAFTKKAAVEEALRLVVQLKGQARIKELWGKVAWRGHDDDWFASDEEIFAKYRTMRQPSAEGVSAEPGHELEPIQELSRR